MENEIGPVQLIAIGFEQPKFGGGITAEFKRLKEQGLVRMLDALVVHKDSQGDVRTIQVTDLNPAEAEQFGALLGGLIGLGAAGEQGIEGGAQAGAEAIDARGGHIFNPSETWDVLEDIPNDTAAALVLLEHRWAIPLRDAIAAEGGRPIGDMWLHPNDLVEVGIIAGQVAEKLK